MDNKPEEKQEYNQDSNPEKRISVKESVHYALRERVQSQWKQIDKANGAVKEANETIKSLEETVEEQNKAMQKQSQNFNKSMTDTKEDYNNKLTKLNETHNQVVQKNKENYEKQLKQEHANYEKRLDENIKIVRKDYEKQIEERLNNIKKDVAEKFTAYKNKFKEIQDEVDTVISMGGPSFDEESLKKLKETKANANQRVKEADNIIGIINETDYTTKLVDPELPSVP